MPSKRSRETWENTGGQDFLQMVRPGQGVISGIDVNGAPYGALANGAGITPGAPFYGTGAPASPLGLKSQIFNVLNFGAVGDGVIIGLQSEVGYTATVHGSNVTSTVTFATPGGTQGFTAGDIGKAIICGRGAVIGTITAVLAANKVTIHGTVTQDGTGILGWGTLNDDAFIAASIACQSFLQTGLGAQQLGPLPNAAVLYIPTGVYFVNLQKGPVIGLLQDIQGVSIIGDGSSASVIAMAENNTSASGVIEIQGKIRGVSIEGMKIPTNTGGVALACGGGIIDDVKVEFWGGLTGVQILGPCSCYNLTVIKNNANGIFVQGGNVDFYSCILSNNAGQGIDFQNSTGQCNWHGGIIDESGGVAEPPANVVVENNNGNIVVISDCTIYADSIDIIVKDTATLILQNCVIAPFSGTGGILIEANSTVIARNCVITAFASPGVTNYAVNNSGVFKDEGGNAVGMESATSNISQSGNTVTVVTNGAEFGLTAQNIGQQMYIRGYVDVPQYNGNWIISGVPSSTSVQFQNPTTGLATSTESGHIGIWSKYGASYNGNPPVVGGSQPSISFALAALTGSLTIGQWSPTEDIRIVRVQISSSQVTSSSVAPVLTLSNGNVSKTITLTSGQQFWDSGILTDTFFSQNLPITVSITQGTSVTPPANLNISIAYDGYGF